MAWCLGLLAGASPSVRGAVWRGVAGRGVLGVPNTEQRATQTVLRDWNWSLVPSYEWEATYPECNAAPTLITRPEYEKLSHSKIFYRKGKCMNVETVVILPRIPDCLREKYGKRYRINFFNLLHLVC